MKKRTDGFTLVESLAAILILAAIVIPTCSALLLSHRMNAKAETLLQGQLAVSSAAEYLQAGMSAEDAMDAFPVGITAIPGAKKYLISFPSDGEASIELEVTIP